MRNRLSHFGNAVVKRCVQMAGSIGVTCLFLSSGFLHPGFANLYATESQDQLIEAVLAVEADVDYGEYLAAECSTCHNATESNNNIPVIHGRDDRDLVAALLEYRDGTRDNETMRSVAGGMSNEEIAALARFLSQFKQ